jgi:thiol-disulfide isomerase/thioredoxin
MAMILLLACVPVLVSEEAAVDAGPWVAPTNSWPTSPPPEGLTAEGFEEGEVVPDFRLMDQFGAEVSLWQFYGSVVVLDISTMWCAPCQQLALGVQEVADTYKDQGFFYLTVFPEDQDGDVRDPLIPDQEDLQGWANYYDIAEPLLSDDEGYAAQVVTEGYPVVLVIDRQMKSTGPRESPSEEQIVATVEEEL